MLERATGCLETAGQRLLWHSGDIVRSRRTLSPRFWQHGELDMPAWYFAFLQPTSPVPGRRRPYRHAKTSVQDDSGHVCLAFLYPSSARNAARSDEPRKHSLARRRAKLQANSRNHHSFGPSKCARETKRYNSSIGLLPSPPELPRIAAPFYLAPVRRDTRSQRLKEIVNRSDESDHDEAWTLYQSIEYISKPVLERFFEYLARSKRDIDPKRLRDAFLELPVDRRTHRIYGIITESLLHTEKDLDYVKEVVREAVLNTRGKACWSVALVYCVKENLWTDMQDLWQFRPFNIRPRHVGLAVEDKPWVWGLSRGLTTLTNAMEEKKVVMGNPEIVKFLLYTVFGSRSILTRRTIQWILRVTQNMHNEGLLEPGHYSYAMETLARSLDTYDADRAMILYRNYCWRMTARPPRTILMDLIYILSKSKQTDRVSFAVDEYIFFYGTVPQDTYRTALEALARAGDISEVDRLLGLFRPERKNSKLARDVRPSHIYDPRLAKRVRTLSYYFPYLYVCGKLGWPKEAHARFKNLHVFGARRDTYCWNALLLAYAVAQDSSGAFSVFDQMRERGLYNSHTFGTLMGMYAKRGDTDKIDELFQMAVDYGVTITTTLLETSVESCIKNGKSEDAERRAEEAASAGYEGDPSRVWNMIIVDYAYRYDIKSAMRVKNRMNDIGIRSTTDTCSALMLALSMVGKTDEARLFLREMHQTSHIKATQFHYSILLGGYVRERKRNMVSVIYHEVYQLFNTRSIKVQLAILQSKIQRDLQLLREKRIHRDGDIKLAHSERFLEQALQNFKPRADNREIDSRLTFKHSFPTSYYHKIISAYGERGAFDRVDKLLQKCESIDQKGEHPLRLLSLLMHTCVKRERYGKVFACWDMAFARTTILASRPPPSGLGRSVSDVTIGSAPAQSTIYPAYRFALASCISHYLLALGHYNRHTEIPTVVRDIEEKGFSLSTRNWSMYVKMLASSENTADQVRAFTTFEEKFMPNFLGWKNILRQKGNRPPGAPERRDIVMENSGMGASRLDPRKIWAKTRPEYMQPTYTTMMYLASALLGFRERSVRDEGSEMRALYEAAPKTMAALTTMPELKEKFQETLLRNNEVKHSWPKQIQFSNEPLSSEGVLGSAGLYVDEEGLHDHEDQQEHDELIVPISYSRNNGSDAL